MRENNDQSPEVIRVVIMDEQPVVREGLMNILKDEPDIEVVGTFDSSKVNEASLQNLDPSVILLDLRLSPHDGFHIMEFIKQMDLPAHVLVFTNYEGDQDIRRSLLLGAKGYLSKSADSEEIIAAVHAVHAGEFFPAHLAQKTNDMAEVALLSPRELEVLTLVHEGLSDKDIASRLGISYSTVKVHVKAILSKLDAESRTHAASIGEKRGFIRSNQ